MGHVIPFGRDDDQDSVGNPAIPKALALMKDALAILDAGGAGFTSMACHLSLAIDHAEGQPVPQSEAECQALLDAMAGWTAGQAAAGTI